MFPKPLPLNGALMVIYHGRKFKNTLIKQTKSKGCFENKNTWAYLGDAPSYAPLPGMIDSLMLT